MRAVFLDTAYAIALSSRADQYHEQAVLLAERLEADGIRLITSRAVVLEIGNALARLWYRRTAASLLAALDKDPNVEVVPLSEEHYQRALRLYVDRQDKEWGITDCVSFIIMQDYGLDAALTTDEHFQQAGFRALLREKPQPA